MCGLQRICNRPKFIFLLYNPRGAYLRQVHTGKKPFNVSYYAYKETSNFILLGTYPSGSWPTRIDKTKIESALELYSIFT